MSSALHPTSTIQVMEGYGQSHGSHASKQPRPRTGIAYESEDLLSVLKTHPQKLQEGSTAALHAYGPTAGFGTKHLKIFTY